MRVMRWAVSEEEVKDLSARICGGDLLRLVFYTQDHHQIGGLGTKKKNREIHLLEYHSQQTHATPTTSTSTSTPPRPTALMFSPLHPPYIPLAILPLPSRSAHPIHPPPAPFPSPFSSGFPLNGTSTSPTGFPLSLKGNSLLPSPRNSKLHPSSGCRARNVPDLALAISWARVVVVVVVVVVGIRERAETGIEAGIETATGRVDFTATSWGFRCGCGCGCGCGYGCGAGDRADAGAAVARTRAWPSRLRRSLSFILALSTAVSAVSPSVGEEGRKADDEWAAGPSPSIVSVSVSVWASSSSSSSSDHKRWAASNSGRSS